MEQTETGAVFNEKAQPSEEFMEEVKGLPNTDFLREVGKKDLYILCRGILGYRDVNPSTHGAFARFVTDEERKRRLGLMPRGHLKSTLAVIGDSTRLAVDDPDETRILIGSETATLAEKELAEIKGHFERNKLFRYLYPEVIPKKFAGPGIQWSGTMATVNRSTSYKEGTWTTVGVGGAVIGTHYNRIKCDDLVGLEASRSPAKMEAAKAWIDTLEPLLINMHTDIIDFIGTRWSRTDLYSYIMKLFGSRLAVFLREAIEDGHVIFPAKMSMEIYETMQRETPLVWYAQYCNNPLAAGTTDFPIGAIRTYNFSMDGEYVIGYLDNENYVRWHLSQLDRVICADPNSGSLTAPDTAAIVVTGVSPDNYIFVLDTYSGRLTPTDFVDKIFAMSQKWRPRLLGIEKAGQQNTQHYFDQKALKEDFWIRTEPLKHGNREKIDRIRGKMEPILRSRRLFCLPTQLVLRKQIDEFPDTELIDELDALAYGPDIWRKPFTSKEVERNRQSLQLLVNRRNRRTGY